MSTLPQLARTAEYHRRIGSTPDPVLIDENEGKTLAETMSDEELEVYLFKDLVLTIECHQEFLNGVKNAEKYFRPEQVIKDIEHLKEIGRLPKLLANFDLGQYIQR